MTRIPHPQSDVETRQAFQQLTSRTDVITTGASDYILVGQGIGVAPVWQVLSSAIDHGGLGGLEGDDHTQYHNNTRGDARYYTQTLLDGGQLDSQYFQESEFLNSSAGAGDAGKPVKLDAAGHIDATMVNDVDIDHGTVGGLGDDDHTLYSLADGTRAFSGVVVGVDPTNSNHLATKEYVDQTVQFMAEYFLTDTASGVGSYYDMVDQDTGEVLSTFTTGPLSGGDGQALTEWITESGVPGVTTAKSGVYALHIHAERTIGNRSVELYFEVYKRTDPGGSETLIVTSELSDEITSGVSIELHASLANSVSLNATDRFVIKVLANLGTGSPTTIALTAEGSTASHFHVPISTEILSTVFLRQDGTKALTGNMSVDGGITIDGRDLSVDGTKLDGIEALADKTDATNVAAAGAAMSGGSFHDGFSDSVGNEHIDHSGVSISTSTGLTGGGDITSTRTLSLSHLGIESLSDAGADKMLFWDDGGSATGWLAVTGTGKGIVTTNLEINAGYVDRGDPSDYDRAIGDFTFDSTWREIDLGPSGLGIIPAGAYAVDLSVTITSDNAFYTMYFRKAGNSNYHNSLNQQVPVAGVSLTMNGLVAVDSNQKIEYFAPNAATWTRCNFVVKGWYI